MVYLMVGNHNHKKDAKNCTPLFYVIVLDALKTVLEHFNSLFGPADTYGLQLLEKEPGKGYSYDQHVPFGIPQTAGSVR